MDIKDVNNIDDLEPSLIAEAEGAQKRQVVKPAEKSAQQTPCQACKCDDVAPRSKLHSFNWLADIPGGFNASDMVEVTFKNTRKGFFRNTNNLQLQCGDILLNIRYQTAIYLGNGLLVHASGNEYGEAIGGEPGDQTGSEICARLYF